MEQKNETLAQKYCTDFEKLTKLIIQYLFLDIESEIKETTLRKDGGVDILVKVIEQENIYNIFIESKLRSGNLNLRDISANIIIAFNKAALTIVTVTNYNYTKQLEEELSEFSTESLLNIKILTGDQIKSLLPKILKPKNSFSSELINLIDYKNSYKKGLPTLLIDLDTPPLYKQFIKNNTICIKEGIYEFPDTWCIYKNELLENLELNKSVIIKGQINNGKSTFIRTCLSNGKYKLVSIDAYLSQTTKQLFLYLLMNVWGINKSFFLELLDGESIDDIVSSIPSSHKEEFKSIFLYLLDKEEYTSALVINDYIIEYILQGILLHQKYLKFVFHIQNIQESNKEILDILKYIIEKSQEYNICTIIDYDEQLYNDLSITEFIPEFMIIKLKIIDIPLLNKKEAQEYLCSTNKSLPVTFVKHIVKNQPLHLSHLCSYLHYLENHNNDFSLDNNNTLINLWNPIDIIIESNNIVYQTIMFLLYLCDRIVPIEIYDQFSKNNDSICKLFLYGYLSLQYDYIYAENIISNTMIEKYVKRFPFGLNEYAIKLNKVMENEKKYILQRIKILTYLKQYNIVLELIDEYYLELKQNKQYSLCLKYLESAIEHCKKVNNLKQLEFYFCEYIEVIVIVKDIYKSYIDDQYKKIIELIGQKNCSQKLIKRYNYIKAMQFYKRRDHKEAMGILATYYNEFLLSKHLDEEWDGILLTRYALCIKEINGDQKALKVFSKLYSLDSENYYIFNGYHSHVSCTLFYKFPTQAKEHYLEMEKKYVLLEKEHSIPFHLYADIAMSDLLKHDFDECKKSCKTSIGLSNSYSVYDELGRTYNILGCVYMCEGEHQKAYDLFNDSLYVLSLSNYKSFRWRTNLNLIHIKILLNFELSEIIDDLNGCYNEFQNLYLEKIINLQKNLEEFYESREFYALVLIFYLSKTLKVKLDVFDKFCFTNDMIKRLKKEIKLIKKNINNDNHHCSYIYSNILFMVG